METALVWFDQARQALMQAKSLDEVKELRNQAEALRLYTKQAGEGLEMQNWCAEIKLRAERRAGELLKERATDLHPVSRERILPEGISHIQSHRWQTIADLPEEAFESHIVQTKGTDKELTTTTVYALAREAQKVALRQRIRAQAPLPLSARRPQLVVASAEALPLPDACVDIIITSPPYNIGPKGGHPEQRHEGHSTIGGRAWAGILEEQIRPEADYQAWQLAVLRELYRVSIPGASLFYNHKVRQREGAMIHPMQWLLKVEGWTLRQQLIWDRGSTHNHEPTYFWPHEELIYWLTKGKPCLPPDGIGQSTVWAFHGPVAETWHSSPFPEELPRRCLAAIGAEGKVVLDPYGGSMTVCHVALEMGARQAIGCDVNPHAVALAMADHGWT